MSPALSRRTRSLLIVTATLAVALVAACSSSGSSASSSSGAAPPPPSKNYVSLGDSYASGYQPGAGNNTNGFAYQLVDKLHAAGTDLQLANFGCAGATTTSILNTPGCKGLGPGGIDYPDQSQAAAAEDYLRTHRGEVALITVSIGGNDITACVTNADPVGCVTAAVTTIKQNVATLAHDLRDAAGPDVQIVGTTYPDVILGAWVTSIPGAQALAKQSVPAFQLLINPALKAAYESAGGTFVDVTEASGAYGSLDEMTTLDPYGSIPAPVAKVCQLTYACDKQDIHPTTEGYSLIADLIAAVVPKS
jgi:lysophospholipase L1-like esterase